MAMVICPGCGKSFDTEETLGMHLAKTDCMGPVGDNDDGFDPFDDEEED